MRSNPLGLVALRMAMALSITPGLEGRTNQELLLLARTSILALERMSR